MPSTSSSFNRAVSLHREATAHVAAARAELAAQGRVGSAPGHVSARRQLAERLDELAHGLARGWLGAPLDRSAGTRKLGIDAAVGRPMYVRVGTAAAVPGVEFPVVLPFVGAGNDR